MFAALLVAAGVALMAIWAKAPLEVVLVQYRVEVCCERAVRVDRHWVD